MSTAIESPVEFVTMLLKPHLADGKLAFTARDIDAEKFFDDLGVRLTENESGELIADISDEQAKLLLFKSLENKGVEKKPE